MTLNMGPQHPSTHGVLRVVLELDGETVLKAKPIIGYLHTGMEKQAEYKTYTQSIPQTDRMDYLAPLSNNLALCLSAEKLLGITVPPRVQAIRVLLTELTRISAHCVWLGTHAIDIGALTVFWYCFREREPYSGYETYDFAVPLGRNGDAYDRFAVRVAEMRQSTRIAKQAIARVRELGEKGEYRLRDFKYVLPPKEEVKTSMEALIHHFKIVAHGFFPPVGEAYQAIEAPKGELGFYFVSDGSARPWRMKVRAPSFVNLQALPVMVQGKLVADVIAAIGSIDIVLGEIDR